MTHKIEKQKGPPGKLPGRVIEALLNNQKPMSELTTSTDKRTTFTLTIAESDAARNFIIRHKCSLKGSGPTVGGRATYVFRPTGIGIICEVVCDCGKKKDITDVSCF